MSLKLFLALLPVVAARLHGRKLATSIERLSPEFDTLIPPDANLEELMSGLGWTEGPVWIQEGDGGYVLFSDTVGNKIWKWQNYSQSVFLDKSGCTTEKERCNGVKEPGANGLTVDPVGQAFLVMCQHAERRVARMEKDGTFTSVATHYEGKRLNSPNDLVFSPWGDLYFTDPPYGLNGKDNDSAKEIPFNGVYRVKTSSWNTLRFDSLYGAPDIEAIYKEAMRPNGLALSADKRHLYVSVSWEPDPHWVDISLNEDGSVAGTKRFLSALPFQNNGTRTGNPDGLKVATTGHIFATGPGGVLVLTPDGKHLGSLLTGKAAANVAFGGDGYLYITATDSLYRVPVLAQPAAQPPMKRSSSKGGNRKL